MPGDFLTLEGDQLVGALLPQILEIANAPKESSSENMTGRVWRFVRSTESRPRVKRRGWGGFVGSVRGCRSKKSRLRLTGEERSFLDGELANASGEAKC